MLRIAAWTCFAALAALAAVQATALGDNAENVVRGKAATAMVEIKSGDERVAGTAFCIEPSGYFVTSNHVIRKASSSGRNITMVLNPGESNQCTVEATVLRQSESDDVAILKTIKEGKYTALAMGSSDGLLETQQLTAFGYPFVRMLAEKPGEYPNITVSVGRITSLRKSGGELDLIQMDASLNPGNSGGPVVDSDGKVVGMVRGYIPGAAMNFSVPANKLVKLMARPEIVFDPTGVSVEQAAKNQDFTLKVTPLLPSTKGKFAVEMVLGNSDSADSPRVLAAKADGNDSYRVTATLLPARKGPETLRARITYFGGSVSGILRDKEVKVDGNSVRLSTVARIEESGVTLHSGKTINGKVSGLDSVELLLGETSATVNAAKAERYEYSLDVASKKGGVTCKLENGPVGMTISPTGVISWQVPADFTDSQVNIIVRI